MTDLTIKTIENMTNYLNTIVNDDKYINDLYSIEDVYQLIDDEARDFIICNVGEDAYDNINDSELCNDFYDARRDAQESLAEKNGLR